MTYWNGKHRLTHSVNLDETVWIQQIIYKTFFFFFSDVLLEYKNQTQTLSAFSSPQPMALRQSLLPRHTEAHLHGSGQNQLQHSFDIGRGVGVGGGALLLSTREARLSIAMEGPARNTKFLTNVQPVADWLQTETI